MTDVGKFPESMIEAVGKPVLKGSMDDHYGSWMHDAYFRHDGTPDKFWVTRKNDTFYILEYTSKNNFKNDTARHIKLPHPFQVGALTEQFSELTDYLIGLIDYRNELTSA